MQRRWWDKSEGPITFQANQQIRKPTAHSASEERRTSGPSLPRLRSHSPDLLPGSGPPQRVQTEEKRGTVGPTVSDSGCCCVAEENIGVRGHRFDLYTDKLVCFFCTGYFREKSSKMDSQKGLVPMVTYRWTLRERIVNVWCLVLFSSLLRSLHMNSLTGFWILLSFHQQGTVSEIAARPDWDWAVERATTTKDRLAKLLHFFFSGTVKMLTRGDVSVSSLFCFVCWKPAKLNSP